MQLDLSMVLWWSLTGEGAHKPGNFSAVFLLVWLFFFITCGSKRRHPTDVLDLSRLLKNFPEMPVVCWILLINLNDNKTYTQRGKCVDVIAVDAISSGGVRKVCLASRQFLWLQSISQPKNKGRRNVPLLPQCFWNSSTILQLSPSSKDQRETLSSFLPFLQLLACLSPLPKPEVSLGTKSRPLALVIPGFLCWPWLWGMKSGFLTCKYSDKHQAVVSGHYRKLSALPPGVEGIAAGVIWLAVFSPESPNTWERGILCF